MFCIVFGGHEFTSRLEGYENVTAHCHNCGNWTAHCMTRWSWFSVCWIPVLPLGSKHKEVYCHVCRFSQDLQNRPDVQSQHGAAKPQGPAPGGPPPGGMQGQQPQQYQQPQPGTYYK